MALMERGIPIDLVSSAPLGPRGPTVAPNEPSRSMLTTAWTIVVEDMNNF